MILNIPNQGIVIVEFKHFRNKGTKIDQDVQKLRDYGQVIGKQTTVHYQGEDRPLLGGIYVFSSKQGFDGNEKTIRIESEGKVKTYYINSNNNSIKLEK